MKIDTLPEWNTVLAGCGCCEMPTTAPPIRVSESITGYFYGQSVAYVDGVDYWTVEYGTSYYDIDGIFHDDERYPHVSRGWNMSLGPCGATDIEDQSGWYPDPATVATTTAGGVVPGSESRPFSAPIFEANILAKFQEFDFTTLACAAGTASVSFRSGDWDEAASLTGPRLQKVRYRWRVPVTHGGKYFKVTWDLLTEPTSYVPWKALADSYLAAVAAHAAWETYAATYAARLAAWEAKVTADDLWQARTSDMEEWITAGSIPPAPADPGDRVLPGDAPEDPGTEPEIPTHPGASPSPAATLEQNLTWVWTGPGDPEEPDGPSWLSPWFDLPPPTVNGERRVVNVRFESYRSTRMGTKPQLTGEGYEIPVLP